MAKTNKTSIDKLIKGKYVKKKEAAKVIYGLAYDFLEKIVGKQGEDKKPYKVIIKDIEGELIVAYEITEKTRGLLIRITSSESYNMGRNYKAVCEEGEVKPLKHIALKDIDLKIMVAYPEITDTTPAIGSNLRETNGSRGRKIPTYNVR